MAAEMSEAEDIEGMLAERELANRMSGWNGSLCEWHGEHRQADPLRPELRERLAAIRARCEAAQGRAAR